MIINHRGGQLGDSPRRSSCGGNLLREPPFNPLVGSYGWSTLDLHMFIPPWYQPPVVQPMSKPTTKLPYKKLRYPTYVKDIDSDAHVRVFKKAIKANCETHNHVLYNKDEKMNMYAHFLKSCYRECGNVVLSFVHLRRDHGPK